VFANGIPRDLAKLLSFAAMDLERRVLGSTTV